VRVLLDECLPKRLKRELVGHDVRTAPEMGWAGKSNGELLTLAARDFDVFLTTDRNLSFQQNVSVVDIAVVVLVAQSNRIEDLKPLARRVLEAVEMAKRGSVTIVSA
jgi:predicted nuclease of predicted toxin-antitoxin system